MRTTAFLLFMILIAPSAGAQHFSIFTSSMYDDNSFAFYEKRADVYHSIFGALNADTQGDYTYLQGYYYGAVVLFRTYDERTYHIHTVGAYAQIQLNYRAEEAVVGANHRDRDDDVSQPTSDDETTERPDSSSVRPDEMPDQPDDDSQPMSPDDLDEGPDSSSVRPDETPDTTDDDSQPMSSDDPDEGPDSSSVRPDEMPDQPDEPVFSDSLVSYLFVIPQIGGRFDQELWDFYDFQRASLLLRLRMHLAGGVMLRPHYTIQYKVYPNLVQFSHLEQLGGLLLNRSLGGAFEVFAGVDAGHKTYTEDVNDTLWVEDRKSGKGKGGVKPPKAVISQFSTPSTTQFVLSAGLVWDILPATELALSYLRRSNLTNDARFVNEEAVFGTTEDEIFDDHYGYQSSEIRLQLEGVLPGKLRTLGSLQLFDKRYPRTATDLFGVAQPGSPQRTDFRLQFQLQVLYPLFRAADGTGLSVGLMYGFVRNQSNNAYHDYNIHQAALLLSGDW